ncbi:LGFP repeat-containing protein, partial [Cellulosimicrobium sp. TH-20]|uniref:LGFP repeat-containing protein n=1 Tax=Cellulosimicrobium sp. TH-20 TaxID=1980001 RepID=UPI0034CE9205
MIRRTVTATLAAVLTLVLAWMPAEGTAQPRAAEVPTAPVATTAVPAAVSGSEFRPGNIVSDAVFYHSGSMSVAAIQTFLNQRGASCVAGEAPCLKNFRETTRNWPVEPNVCRGYTGRANESAAQIIAGVSAACGINPRVLLVLLEKEQSLVTRTRPTKRAYQTATGFGCPDTAPCNAEYYGFFNQVYRAARQYQVYRANPTRYGYQAGRVNYVRYNPNQACGGSNVYIENQATAGLYIYTPYQPNAAALARLYGTGDSCSAYGNRNFWRLFTDWFGSTSYSVFGAIATAWSSNGGRDGYFGAPTSNEQCRADGACAQRFERGTITYRPGTGITLVIGGLHSSWQKEGGQTGYFGFPLGPEQCRTDGACAQRFERGTLTYRPGAPTVYVIGGLHSAWQKEGGQTGYFGFPLGPEQCRTDGA